MWQELGIAIALLLVIEGILPFLNPSLFRQTLEQMQQLPDQHLRVMGLVSMVLGVLLLYGIH